MDIEDFRCAVDGGFGGGPVTVELNIGLGGASFELRNCRFGGRKEPSKCGERSIL